MIFFSFFRPGFVRVNLPFFMGKDTVDFVLEAVDVVATHGWKLLPQVSKNIHFHLLYDQQ